MSASYLALGNFERFANVKSSDLILTTAQLNGFRASLAQKLSELGDPGISDPMQIQFLRGEIAAFTTIINTSVAALEEAEQSEQTGD